MSRQDQTPLLGAQKTSDLMISLAMSTVVLFFLAAGLVSYWNTRTIGNDALLVSQTHNLSQALEELVSITKDAETGQRGFVLTGDEKYLAPYSAAITHMDVKINDAEKLVRETPEIQDRMPAVREHIQAKLSELAETIVVRRTKGFEATMALIETDRGKNEMDTVRTQISAMQADAENVRALRLTEMDRALNVAIVSGLITGLLGMLLSAAVAYLIQKTVASRRREQWLQAGQVGLSSSMLGELTVEELGTKLLTFLSTYFDAHVAAFFVRDGISYRRVSTYGLSAASGLVDRFESGEGLLGQAAKDHRTVLVRNVPEGYVSLSSALGKGNARHLLISPAIADRATIAVLEFGFIHPLSPLAIELLDNLSESIGVAVRSANYRANLQDFLEETQRQSEELQAQSEELRVANEELEEQSRILKESQSRLEQQQAEQEQTNAQLEEQTQILEDQKDDLTRTKAAVEQKAQELERASRYKSDFLANMSHELRTPLNSSLIMAKLLADNPHANLTEEQVKFAETIQSSGNDLLTLINDILDLSKIEAGHMEIHPETLSLERLANNLKRLFDPLMKQKGLTFETHLSAGCPVTLETDHQRLEQVLKNLLSNAIKFTERGGVKMIVRPLPHDRVAIDIVDTGIGISQEHQLSIFEAFRQADGTISRKYGGTGLGLSISRELTRLLGGSIELVSKPGHGSTFTVNLPNIFNAADVVDPAIPESFERTSQPNQPADTLPSLNELTTKARSSKPKVLRQKRLHDDRDQLKGDGRLILIVEDDESFAGILSDMVHEMNFQCLIETTAEDALIVALQYLPSAVVLDVGLPDHSGLSVLDRLKRDGRTRHIPVHVISASDHAQTALSLGAVGYMLKPVTRENLSESLKRLETRMSQQLRRVLIVEDDATQRESVRKLLGSRDVETVAVGTAAECLECLKTATFDCMVLDLALPDATGYALLETLSQEDAYSFPPVIVYTGRDLSVDEEMRLRRYSQSIIIKGAKSPERLLDEVTLFLHKVVAEMPADQQRMIEQSKNRDSALERRRILVVEDDIRNVYALTSIFEPRGAVVEIARNGREALTMLEKFMGDPADAIDLILMDVMMPEMDGMTATREIRKRKEWNKIPVIMLTAKAMKDDQERCLDAGANDYMAKPLDVEKLLSLVRVWMPR